MELDPGIARVQSLIPNPRHPGGTADYFFVLLGFCRFSQLAFPVHSAKNHLPKQYSPYRFADQPPP